jgi:hypothetical protein
MGGHLDDTPLEDIDVRTPPSMSLPIARGDLTHVRDDASVKDFLAGALAQVGDKYRRGVENKLDNADPTSWDGSELVEWAANRAGSMVNDGPANQFRQMRARGTALSVEQALKTPGAVLYEFTGDPASPTRASTANSLGDGRIIDIDPQHGVRVVDAKDFTFTHAGALPGFVDSLQPGADVTQVVQDAVGAPEPEPTLGEPAVEPPLPPVPPAPEPLPPSPPGAHLDEADFLTKRAEHLRALQQAKLRSDERTDLLDQQAEARRDAGNAYNSSVRQMDLTNEHKAKAAAFRAEADDLDVRAAGAQKAGDTTGAAELREQAATARTEAIVADRLAARSDERVKEFDAKMNSASARAERLELEIAKQDDQMKAAEAAIDAIETKAQLLREADAQEKGALDAEREAAKLQENGDLDGAQAKRTEAEAARNAAAQAAGHARGQHIDEAALRDAGLQAPAPDAEVSSAADWAADPLGTVALVAAAPAADATDATDAADVTDAADATAADPTDGDTAASADDLGDVAASDGSLGDTPEGADAPLAAPEATFDELTAAASDAGVDGSDDLASSGFDASDGLDDAAASDLDAPPVDTFDA